MASNSTDRIQKSWMAKQIRHSASLKTIAGVRKFQKTLLDILDEKDTIIQPSTAKDLTFDQVVEIFGLKVPYKPWKQDGEMYRTPKFLTSNLAQLKKAPYDKNSEAYSRIAIDFLIIACTVKHKDILSMPSRLPAKIPATAIVPILEQSELLTDDSYNQIATTTPILDQATEIIGPSDIAPTTPVMIPESTSQPKPIKVFPEMSLSVRVKRGSQERLISGIADWAMGYGDRAALEDGTVLLAVEAKRREKSFNAEGQLLAYLATIRQLRIQANKKNVTTQGFFSDGENYRFMCIRNNGAIMKSLPYDISMGNRSLNSVFNFLLGMLITAAKSLPNTSPTKPGPDQDEEIENFDRDVFVEVNEEDIDMEISTPIIYHDEIVEDEWPDIELPEE